MSKNLLSTYNIIDHVFKDHNDFLLIF